MSADARQMKSSAVGRFFGAMNLVLFLLSVVAIAITLNYFAHQSSLRVQFDATKTRAYSLSPQTLQLLSTLEGEWTVALLMNQAGADAAVSRQIDEVLRRFDGASDNLNVVRIDPADSASVEEYDKILTRLKDTYSDLVGQYELALDEAEAAYLMLQAFAQEHKGNLQALMSLIPREVATRGQLAGRVQFVSNLAAEAGKVLDAINDSREVSDVQPIPDYEGARSIYILALRAAMNQFNDLALLFRQWREIDEISIEVKSYLSESSTAFEDMTQRLANAADPLTRLAPLELSGIGRQIQEGECALILGPDRASAIRASQLFPRTKVRATAGAAVTFDQRFRGEQLIASAIRSLLTEHMPLVVFVHSNETSLFRSSDNQMDLVGVKQIFFSARFDIKEWSLAKNMPRPQPLDGQPVVWIIVPPSTRPQGLEPSKSELDLINATKGLLADGEPVMLNLFPSLLAKYGSRDPWDQVISAYGVTVDTSRTIFERQPLAGGQRFIERGQTLESFSTEHLVGRAANGLPAYFSLPMAIRLPATPSPDFQHDVIAQIEPSPTRWLESEWNVATETFDDPLQEEVFTEALPIVLAVKRKHPTHSGRQRLFLTTSGVWMMTAIADRVYMVGGQRVAMEFPGNYELLLASVAWLAGMDDLIAPSPMSQEIARLKDITTADRRLWSWLTLGALPGLCIGLGLMMWLARRY